MRTILTIMFLSLTTASMHAEKEVDINKLSEAFGNFIGRSIKSPEVEFNIDSLILGIRNGSEGKPSPLTEEEYQEGMASLQEEMFSKMSKENLLKSEDFLTSNKTKKNITSSDDNKLQYEIIQSGDGEFVEPDGRPEINYTGKFLDGETFGSSDETGPITLNLTHTIPGFRKGIAGMREGEKRRLYIHPDLGYGITGQLPPNSLLIFEVEILKANSEEDDEMFDEDENEDYGDIDFDEIISP
ncbi:FKBP-type peptidyl-prolyl cis-trans isomerase [Chlamydiales bacterium]|nr:FKBP-type peptidyl-prolyl cis-trans isomerase [Chlamydiales bacterium]